MLFLIPVFVGALLRLFGLTRQSLWVDEIATIRGASLGEPFRFVDVLINPQGPLPQVLLRLWTAVGGTGDSSLRLWAATAGILGLLLAALAFRRLWPRAALTATWLLALSPFHIWYSQEVRNYVFLLAAATLVLWSLTRAVELGGRAAWAGHACALLALMLCNLSGVFLLPALGLWVLLDQRKSFGPWLAAAAAALLLASPWLWAEYGGHIHWAAVAGGAEAPTVRGSLTYHPGALPFTFATFVGGFGLGPPLRELHGALSPRMFLPHLPWLLPAAVAATAATAAAATRWREPRVRLLFWWSFLPALLVAAVAVVGLKAFNPRYAAASQPIFMLLLAGGLRVLWDRRRVWGAAAVVCLVVPMLAAVGRQALDADYAREDFRGAARYLEIAAAEGDLIIQQGADGPLAHYYRGPVPLEIFFAVTDEDPRVTAILNEPRRVWWVGSRLWWDDPDRILLKMLEARGRPLDAWAAPGIEVRGFQLEPEVR